MLRSICALAQVASCVATSSQLVKESWFQSRGDIVSSSVVVGEKMISHTCTYSSGPVSGPGYGTIAAYNDTTGEQIWAFGVDGGHSVTGCTSDFVLVPDRIVFLYDQMNRTSDYHYETVATYMIALHPTTGKTLWNITGDFKKSDRFHSAGELIVLPGTPVLALEAETGDVAWSFNGTESFALKSTYSGVEAVNEALVLVTLVSADGREAIGYVDVQSGSLTWALPTAKGTSWSYPYFGLPDRLVLKQEEDYDHTKNKTLSTNLTALDIRSGEVLWTASPFSSPLIHVDMAGAVAFVMTPDKVSLQAVDLATGDVMWTLSASFLQNGYQHPLIVKGNLLCWDGSTKMQDRILYGVDVASGEVKWNATIGHLEHDLGGLTADDSRIFVAVVNGDQQPYGSNIIAIDAATGRKLWTRGMSGIRHFDVMMVNEIEVLFADGPVVWSLDAATGVQKWTNSIQHWVGNNVVPYVEKLFVRGKSYYAAGCGSVSKAVWYPSGKWTVSAAEVDILSLGIHSDDTRSFPQFCLDLPGNDAHHGASLWIWECNGAPNQQWSFLDGSLVFPGNANLCVTLTSGVNVSVELQNCTGSEYQTWSLDEGHLCNWESVCLAPVNMSMGAALIGQEPGHATWQLVHFPEQAPPRPLPERQVPWSEGFSLTVPMSKATTLAVSGSESKVAVCLDMLGGDPIEGYTVAGWNCILNSEAQSWIVLPATNQIAFAADMRKCLTLRGSNVTVGAVTEIRECDASNQAQQWELDFESGHIKYIMDSSFCLDIKETPLVDGASNTVQLQKCGNVKYSWKTSINSQTEMVQCVDVATPEYSTTKSGAVVQLWGCNQLSNQRWVLKEDGSVVIASSANLCLDVVGGEARAGAPLQVWECNGQPSQQWHLQGAALIYGPNSTFCVEAFGAPGASRAHLAKCDETAYGQRFSVSKPEPNPTEISMWDYPNICLHLCDKEEMPAVEVYSCGGTYNEGAHGQAKMHWRYQARTSQLVSLNSSQCLSLPNANASNGVQLLMADCNEGEESQRWNYDTSTGLVSFGIGAAYCMDLPGNVLRDSNYLQLWECNGLSEQRWRINALEENVEHWFI